MSQAGRYTTGTSPLAPVVQLTPDNGNPVTADAAQNIDVFGGGNANGYANIETNGNPVGAIPLHELDITLKNSIFLPADPGGGVSNIDSGVFGYILSDGVTKRSLIRVGPIDGGNLCVGVSAGNFTMTGQNNTLVGTNAGTNITTSDQNVLVGWRSGLNLLTGRFNCFIGHECGELATSTDSNTFVGRGAGQNILTGSNSIIIGRDSGTNFTGAESNNISIGEPGTAGISNRIRIGRHGNGNFEQNSCFIAGIRDVSVSNAKTVVINTATSQLGVSGSMIGGWTVVTAAAQNISAGAGYIANFGGTTTFTLPATSSVGDTFRITGINNPIGWKIGQQAGQSIHWGSMTTAVGVGGSITSDVTYAAIECVCVVANTQWNVLSVTGNPSIV